MSATARHRACVIGLRLDLASMRLRLIDMIASAEVCMPDAARELRGIRLRVEQVEREVRR